MKENLEKQLLQTITLDDQHIHWVEKGKELLINGKLFDVENMEAQNGTIVFTGLYDDEETVLIKKLDESCNKKSAGNDQLLSGFFKCLQDIFCDDFLNTLFFPGKPNHLLGPAFPQLPDQFGAILSPPPQLLIA